MVRSPLTGSYIKEPAPQIRASKVRVQDCKDPMVYGRFMQRVDA
jgi:hypothetical protein